MATERPNPGPATTPMTTDDYRSQLAARFFPKEWTLAISGSGKRASKKRQQLRQRAVAEVKLRELRAAGASCANCGSYQTKGGAGRPWCEAESDYYGFVSAGAGGLCVLWSPNANPSTPSIQHQAEAGKGP